MSGSDAELLAELAALPPVDVLVDRLRQRATFLERAAAWLDGRGGVVRLPEDRAAIVALGVPCEVCGAVVTEDGQGGHLVEMGAARGDRFGASIVARCGRPGPAPRG